MPSCDSYACVSLIEAGVNCTVKKNAINVIICISYVKLWNINLEQSHSDFLKLLAKVFY